MAAVETGRGGSCGIDGPVPPSPLELILFSTRLRRDRRWPACVGRPGSATPPTGIAARPAVMSAEAARCGAIEGVAARFCAGVPPVAALAGEGAAVEAAASSSDTSGGMPLAALSRMFPIMDPLDRRTWRLMASSTRARSAASAAARARPISSTACAAVRCSREVLRSEYKQVRKGEVKCYRAPCDER